MLAASVVILAAWRSQRFDPAQDRMPCGNYEYDGDLIPLNEALVRGVQKGIALFLHEGRLHGNRSCARRLVVGGDAHRDHGHGFGGR
jgi:hypothetical protein